MSLKTACSLLLILCILCGCEKTAITERPAFRIPGPTVPADSLLKLANTLKREAGNRSKRAYAALMLGTYYVKIGSYRQAENELNAGMALLRDRPDTVLRAATSLMLGRANKNLGDYATALDQLADALSYYERVNDRESQATVHVDMGQIFQLKGDLPQATSHLTSAAQLLGSQKYSVTYLKTLHTLANVYGMRNQLDSALALDEEGLAIARSMNLPELTSTFLDNKATCYTVLKQYDSARALYNQCLQLDLASGNKKQVSDTWLNLGILAQLQRRYPESISCINTSLKLAGESGYRRGEAAGWQTLVSVYKDQGDYRQAFAASERYFALKDSLVDERKESAIAEWKAIYETEKKDREIGQQQALILKKNLLILLLSITAPLGLLVIYFASRRNKIRKEKAYREALFASEQRTATDILWAGEKERRRIAADLHDGVGQVLTAALLNLQALGPAASLLPREDAQLLEKAAGLVRSGCSEIRQISHNMMPVVLLKNGLVFALQEFVSVFHQKAFSVHLSVDMPEVRLPEGIEVMLYRVIQECVNNVVRHAGATRLDIAITHEEQHISIMIEDNGVGLNARSESRLPGIGMDNVRSRVAWMHGTVEWSSVGADGRGTLVAIYIPVV